MIYNWLKREKSGRLEDAQPIALTNPLTLGWQKIKEVIDYIRSFIPELKFTLKPGPFGMPMDYDTTPLEKEIGFRPKYSMEEGVLKALNIFRRQAGLKKVRR